MDGKEAVLSDDSLKAKLYLWEHECWLEQGIGLVEFTDNSATKTPPTVRLIDEDTSACLLYFDVEPDPLCLLLPHMFTESAWVLTITDLSLDARVARRIALIFKTTSESQRFQAVFEKCKKGTIIHNATHPERLQGGLWARNVEKS
jgi:hypothetical protein